MQLAPVIYIYIFNETIVFSIQTFIHCFGPHSALRWRSWQTNRIKTPNHHNQGRKKTKSFTIVDLSYDMRPSHALRQKLILENNLWGLMPRKWGNLFINPILWSQVIFRYMKAGSRTELVVSCEPIILLTTAASCTLPPGHRLLLEPDRTFQALTVLLEVFLVKVVQIWSSSHHTCAWVWLG